MKIRVVSVVAAWWALLPYSAQADLIINGGFEDGVFISTIAGGTNEAPAGWAPSAGFDAPGNFNSVTPFNPHTGGYDLFLGNDLGYPLASLSQTFTTMTGTAYAASFYVANVAPTGFLEALVDGAPEVTVANASIDPGDLTFTATSAGGRVTVSIPASRKDYILESFSFIGTGTDTLTLAAENVYSSYQIDDVSVTPVTEPTGWTQLLLGCAVAVAIARCSARRSISVEASATTSRCGGPRWHMPLEQVSTTSRGDGIIGAQVV